MTRKVFTERLVVRLQMPTTEAGKSLLTELKKLTDEWTWDTYYSDFLADDPISYIRLDGKYRSPTLRKVFSKLGLVVTRVTYKPGKGCKTIVHFKDISFSK